MWPADPGKHDAEEKALLDRFAKAAGVGEMLNTTI